MTTTKPARKPAPRRALESSPPAKSEPAVKETRRPYVLESAVVIADYERHRARAQSELETLDAEMLAIEKDANDDIMLITARRDAELTGRRQRKADLERIIAMSDRALSEPRTEPMLVQPEAAE